MIDAYCEIIAQVGSKGEAVGLLFLAGVVLLSLLALGTRSLEATVIVAALFLLLIVGALIGC